MSASTIEAHPELYHYTTAVGMQGILMCQELWATDIAYLNDAEEHVGFFSRRLPGLLDNPLREAVDRSYGTPPGRQRIELLGGKAKFLEDRKTELNQLIRNVTLKFNEPYVTAFCSPKAHLTSSDGLLSQWRGYGVDGGYAVVFNTKRLHALMEHELQTYHYQFGNFGDVDYYDEGAEHFPPHPERTEWESTIQQSIRKFILAPEQGIDEKMHVAIASLSCRCKHGGFREESEVRIVVMRTTEEVYKMAYDDGDTRPRKTVHFVAKSGVLVPYVKLFENKATGNTEKLPITKIIVGPHPEKVKRRRAIQRLLKQNEIDAEVTVSDIPYLGR